MATLKRIYAYDILKIMAIFCVILTHVTAFNVVHSPVGTAAFNAAVFYDSLSHVAVPLFFMISGALLLDNQKCFDLHVMAKYVKRTFILVTFWAFVYEVYTAATLRRVNGAFDFEFHFQFGRFLHGYFHLWFLFAIMGLYLITPILKTFVKKENVAIIRWFIILSLVFQFILPVFDYIAKFYKDFSAIPSYLRNFRLQFVMGYTAYYLLGWYLANINLRKIEEVIVYAAGALSFFVILMGIWFLSYYDPKAFGMFLSNHAIFKLLFGAAVFLLFLRLFKGKTPAVPWSEMIIRGSSLVFGIYAIHVLVMRYVEKICFFRLSMNPWAPWLFFPVKCLVVAAISFLLVYALSKIPVVKKIVKC